MMREACPGISIKVKCRQTKAGWIALCKAGFDDGAYPMWQHESADRAVAIQMVVRNAWSYWVRTIDPRPHASDLAACRRGHN